MGVGRIKRRRRKTLGYGEKNLHFVDIDNQVQISIVPFTICIISVKKGNIGFPWWHSG